MSETVQIRAGVVIAERYRVIDRLGHGGMATVFLAEDLVLSRQVAVKRLHTEASGRSAERFKREAQLGAALNHPNIVAVYDTISGPDGLLIVMEYVPGQALSGLLAGGPLDPPEAVRILRAVADALDYAHARGVIHRDVKPANILVRDDGVVKLSDLGVATAAHVSRLTTSLDVLGTLGYIAPERLDGEQGGPAADVYSLAAVAFEVLSGQRPYRGATPAEVLQRSASEPAPDLRQAWPHASAAAAGVLQRGLDPDPDQRPLSAGRLIDQLGGALERSGTVAVAVRQAKPVPVAVSSRTLLRAALVGGLLAVLGAVVALLLASGGGSRNDSEPVAGAAGNGNGSGERSRPSSEERSTTTTTTTTTTAGPPATPAPAAGASGAELNARGYELIQEGRPEEAVPVLQRAVAAFAEGTRDINYAYALYNLGHALRLVGRPEEAIPILEERLQIPNQVPTVRQELAAARAEVAGGKKVKKGKKEG